MLYLLVALAIYHIAVNNGSVNGCDDVRNGVAVPYYHVRVLAHFKAAYAVANAGICGGIDCYGLPCFLLRQSVAHGKAGAKGQRLYRNNRVVRYYCKGTPALCSIAGVSKERFITSCLVGVPPEVGPTNAG